MMMRRSFLITTLTVFALFGPLLGQPEKQAVEQAERGWAKAVVAADLAALDKIFTDDLIYTHSNAVIDHKADYIRKLRSGEMKYQSIDYESMEVRVYGDAAVVHSKARIKAQTTSSVDFKALMLHVWVRSSGEWRLAAHQTTRLP